MRCSWQQPVARSCPVRIGSERARLTGSVASGRIVLRLGTRHRWVVFVGRLVDEGRAISGVCKVSLPERLLLCRLVCALQCHGGSGRCGSLSAQGPTNDLKPFLAIAVAMLILGFFATRLSWLGRRGHVAWIANFDPDGRRCSAQPIKRGLDRRSARTVPRTERQVLRE